MGKVYIHHLCEYDQKCIHMNFLDKFSIDHTEFEKYICLQLYYNPIYKHKLSLKTKINFLHILIYKLQLVKLILPDT